MSMNRGAIVQAMADYLSWDAPDDPRWQARARRFVDSAYKRCVADCPEALVPDELRIRLPGTYSSGSGDAVTSFISTTSDPFVLSFSSSATSSFTPQTDRSWDGLYWLEITLTDGTVWRGQCREFWTEISGGVNNKYVTIDRPWTLPPLVNARYRLSPNYIWLRDDIIRVVAGQRFGSTGSPLSLENITSAIWHDEWSNLNSRQYNYPRRLRAERTYQHPAPNRAPTATIPEQDVATWGPEPWGQFDYCITYIWGYRDPAQKSLSGNFIPLFESAPSPVSNKVTVAGNNDVVQVALPDIAWELNYGDPTTLRYGRTGWMKRVYRRRYSVTGGANTSIESPEVFQFLADVDDITTSFTDDGSIVPDYSLRLPEPHGYRAWSPWPLPSGPQYTEYQLLVQRAAEALLNDNDAPRVAPQCEDAVAFMATAYLARNDKDTATAEKYEDKSREVLAKYRRDMANPTGQVERESWEGTGRPRGGWPRASNA